MRVSNVLVVVPALNEGQTIAGVVTELCGHGYTVLVVDDGSTDDTAEIARRHGALVLQLSINLGVGGALRAGFRYAVEEGFDAVIQVDADGQHPTHQVSNLIESAISQQASLVIGSRYLSPDATLVPSAPRHLAMRILSWYATHAAGTKITDSTSGFRIICEPLLRRFADNFPCYYLGDTFEATVHAARSGFRIVEIPAALRPRHGGVSTVGNVAAVFLILKVLLLTTLQLHMSR